MGVWNPDVIFNLINPDRRYYTCTGHACTYGRRCRRPVASATVARSFLCKLATEDPIAASKSPVLEEAAKLTLCYQHTRQILELVGEWRACLLRYAASTAGESSNQQERAENQRTEEGAGREQHKKEREEQARRKKEKVEADERKARQKAEERRRAQQRAEESDGQKEHEKMRAEQEYKERTARQQQNSRQRAEEREAAEKQEWEDAWSRYCKGWMLLETGRTQVIIVAFPIVLVMLCTRKNASTNGRHSLQATPSKVPWPVKSGRWEDVNRSSVRYFFRKAVPIHLADHQGEEMYRTVCNENKRWHTDKITSKFGPEILKGQYGDAMNMIAKLMVQMRTEAKMERGKQRL